jgi:hypothetical protein
VPVEVVDLLEVVDVEEEDAEGPAVAMELGQPLLEDVLAETMVPDPGQRVEEGDLLELLDPADRLDPARLVGEDLDRFHDPPPVIADRSGPDEHRDPVPSLVLEKDPDLAALPVEVRGRQRVAVTAEVLSLAVHVPEEVVVAVMPEDLGLRIAGDPLGGPVQVSDSLVQIHEVDAVVQVVDQLTVEGVVEKGTENGFGERRHPSLRPGTRAGEERQYHPGPGRYLRHGRRDLERLRLVPV